MKNSFFLLAAILFSVHAYCTQCNPSVTIRSSSNANNPVSSCAPVIDTFWAVHDSAGSTQTYNWYVNGGTTSVGTDSILIYPITPGNFANYELGTQVEVQMNAGCSVFSVQAYTLVNPVPQNITLTQHIYAYNADSSKITFYASSFNVDSIYINLQYQGSAYYQQNLSLAVSPRGTALHPTLDSISAIVPSGGSAWTVLECADTLLRCSFTHIGDTIPVTVFSSVLQPLCLVSIDTITNKPLVIWDKVDKYATDSFYLYRADGPLGLNPVFQQIAVINRDSLSEWEDTSAYPGIRSYGYTISALDTSGLYSAQSPYQWTMFLSSLGSGLFSWTPYIIENDTLPLGTYDLYRDALGNGNWQILSSVSDTQTRASDPNYASYPNARYMVLITLTNACNPTRNITTIMSNVLSRVNPNGLENTYWLSEIKIQPNPIHSYLDISCPSSVIYDRTVKITNTLGQIIYNSEINNGMLHVNTQNWQSGVYFVTVSSTDESATVRVVKY